MILYAGKITKNPFDFQNMGITKLCLFSGGVQIPSTPLEPNFTNAGSSILSYNTLFSDSGIHYEDSGNDMDRSEFNNGYALWCFDLTPDLSGGRGTHWNPIRLGNFRIDIAFTKGLDKTITCVIYAEFPTLMQIDLKRKVTVKS